MQIIIFSLFPEYFNSVLKTSVVGKALASSDLVKIINIRDFTTDKHHTTDDRPYGGGPGMVMMVEPIHRALQAEKLDPKQKSSNQKVFLTSAKGSIFTQQTAQSWSKLEKIGLICGHYEGVDERVAEHLIDGEIRIGDYVLTGGEPAAAVMLDAVIRLLPGTLGNEQSIENESHTEIGLGAHPTYTRPVEYNGWQVPSILQSGHHEKIETWREEKRKKL